jgi:ATP-binding cassette subfamily C protein LapB
MAQLHIKVNSDNFHNRLKTNAKLTKSDTENTGRSRVINKPEEIKENVKNQPDAHGISLLEMTSLHRYLPELGISSIIINILTLSVPIAMLQVYDRIIPHQSGSTLGLLVGGVAAALAVETLVRLGRNYVTGWIGASFDHKLSCASFERLLNAKLADYEQVGASVHMERLRASGQMREFFSGQALLAIFDLPFMLVYIFLIGLIGGWLVLVPIVLLALFFITSVVNGLGLRKDIMRRVEFEERRFSFISEALGGIHSVKSMAMEAIMQRRYEMLQDDNAKRNFEGSQHSIAALNLGAMFAQLTTMGVVGAGTYHVIDGNMTPGALAACILLAGRSLQPLQSVLATWVRFQGYHAARVQIDKLFSLRLAANTGRPPLPEIKGDIAIEKVSYGFPKAGALLFKDLDFHAKAGECVAIVGDSGSGKSSLLSLMNGIAEPLEGRVVIDGMDISEHDKASVAQRIGYLPQQGVLFEGTIMENMTMFDRSLEPKALDIAEKLGLDRVVATMRNGYETRVGTGSGESTPAGVKQRIAIVRALVLDPQVILFDEANIAIDSAGDAYLSAYLESLKGKRTIILVTPRPSLLKMADRIVSINQGRLVDGQLESPAALAAAVRAQSEPALPGVIERPPADERLATNLIARFRTHSDLSLSLTGLLTALEWRGNLRQLAESLPHVADSLDLTGLRRVMANLGYRCREKKTRMNEIDPRQMPCLFLPEDGPARVLLRPENEEGKIFCFNGETVQTEHLPNDATPGEVYVFTLAEPEAPLAPGESWLKRILGRFRGLLWLAMLVTIVINVLTISTAMFIMSVLNVVVPSGHADLIPLIMIGLVLGLGLEYLLRQLRGKVLSFIGARGEFIVGSVIFQRLMSLPIFMTEQVPVGSQLSRIKDFENLREMFVGPVALLFYELPGIIVFVVVLGLINPWILVVLLGAIFSFLLLGFISEPGMVSRSTSASKAMAQRQEFLTDVLSKVRAVRYSGFEETMFARFRILSGKACAMDFASQQYSSRIGTLAQAMGLLTGLATLVVCVLGAFTGSTSTGAVVASMMITWRLVAPMQNGFTSMSMLIRLGNSVRQIDNLARIKGEREQSSIRKAPPLFKGDLSFSRVSFRYSNDADPALLGVSFNVPHGQIAAIAGPNGSGKSTALKLVTGIYHPQAGSVRLDNVDIRQLDPADIRSMICYVPQRCDIFFGTVAQNLRLTHPTANDAELRWAADMAGLLDDVNAMPEGFNTRLVDGQGERLANGFKQRLSLARAYLRKAPVMLFDEPGNGLDNEGDKAFVKALERLRGKVTSILVSHRPSHLKLADSVIYMEEGYVRQVGTFDQVKGFIFGNVR